MKIMLEKQNAGLDVSNETIAALMALRAKGWSIKVAGGRAWASGPPKEERLRAWLDPEDWARAREYAECPEPGQAARFIGLLPKLVRQLKLYEEVIYGPDNS